MRRAIAFLLHAVCILSASSIEGVLSDSSGARIPRAAVELRTPSGVIVGTAATDAEGRFSLASVPPGALQLRIVASGFEPHEIPVFSPSDPLNITLDPANVYSRVTVSATRGSLGEPASSPHVESVRDFAELINRPGPLLGNALANEPGILVQQSAYGQVSPFLRGLTGYHVLNLVDGIRFNNSTFRSGPNQYLAYIEPAQAARVETMLGPASAQYGSDALGGAIQVITPGVRFSGFHGEASLFAGSADASGGASANFGAGGRTLSWMVGISGRRHNDPRAGGGWDSRNVFHRLFGMTGAQIRNLIGGRQQDAGFGQYGAHTKFAWRPRPDQILTGWFQRGELLGVRGYKDLLGGLGRMQSSFEPQILNFFYGRWEKLGFGALDSLSATFSINSQTDGGVRQGLRSTDAVTRERNRVDSYGYSAQGSIHRARLAGSFGADFYDERIDADRTVAGTPSRPLYPNNSAYRTLGAFGQGSAELVPGKLRTGFGGRFTEVRFRAREDLAFGIPDSSQAFRDLTYHASLSWQVTRIVGLHAITGRGFRAPNLNDLGAVGLNDLGYELPAAAAIGSGALLSTDAGEGAVSKGEALTNLRPESLWNYEAGVRFTTNRFYARVQGFDAELRDPIVRRTLLFSAGAAPASLAGLPVSVLTPTAAQRAQNVVTVATALDPRAVKVFANDGQARYYGIESLARLSLASRWSVEAQYSFLAGRELHPNRNARRLPPQNGSISVTHYFLARRAWVEAGLSASGAQERLSGGDFDDERIGASRRRRDVADFFNGSRVQPFVSGGVFLPTGETLRQIQDRVLPGIADDVRVPLYVSTAGWFSVNLRAGMPLGERLNLFLALENMADRNYRIHGSGVDSPGRNAYAALRWVW